MRLRIVALLVLALSLSASRAGATVILDVPAGWVDNPQPFDVDLWTSAFNGAAVQGQTLSVDFLFSDGLIAQFTHDSFAPFSFVVVWNIFTTATTFPGMPDGSSSGWLIGADGSRIETASGVFDGSDGTTAVGLQAAEQAVLEVQGFHFDFVLPTTPYVITDGQIRIGGNSHTALTFVRSSTEPVPEPPALLLIPLGLAWLRRQSVLNRRSMRRHYIEPDQPQDG
jgi:hypothetical protein